jgi:lipopolysaccharide export LptBFGC system permease protein LptF
MAKEKKNLSLQKASSGALADLIGNSVSIQLADGSTVLVPVDRQGNRIANMVVAAEVRHLLQNSIKTYRDKDMLPTPKDLKDLAEAAKSLSQFSGEIYKEDDAPLQESPRKAEKATASVDEVNFDEVIVQKPEDNK